MHIIVLPDGSEISSGPLLNNAIKSIKLTQSVNIGEDIVPGSAFADIMEAKIFSVGGGVNVTAGDEVVLYKQAANGTRKQLGIYILEKPTRPAANTMNLTGYSRIIKLDKDLTQWLNGLTGWPYALTDFAEMVCEACGLRYRAVTVPNGDFPVYQFFKAGVTGRQIMRWLGEICCRYCYATADGYIAFGWYASSGVTIRQTGDRFYYPNSLAYETYQTEPVDAVQLRLADSTSGALWPSNISGTVTATSLNIRSGPGTGYAVVGSLANGSVVQILEQTTVSGNVWGRVSSGWVQVTGYVTLQTAEVNNPYIITGNAILLARVTEDIIPYLETIKAELARATYTPCKVSVAAGDDIKAGSTVDIVDGNGQKITAYVTTKTTTGRRDNLESVGNARRNSSSSVSNRSVEETVRQQFANQTQQEAFNTLTKNGLIQGIYVQDGRWYINAEVAQLVNLVANLITAGVLKSVDGTTYFDLDNAEFVCSNDYGTKAKVRGGAFRGEDKDGNVLYELGATVDGGCSLSLMTGDSSHPGYAFFVSGGSLFARAYDEESDAVQSYRIGFKTINGVRTLVAYD